MTEAWSIMKAYSACNKSLRNDKCFQIYYDDPDSDDQENGEVVRSRSR